MEEVLQKSEPYGSRIEHAGRQVSCLDLYGRKRRAVDSGRMHARARKRNLLVRHGDGTREAGRARDVKYKAATATAR